MKKKIIKMERTHFLKEGIPRKGNKGIVVIHRNLEWIKKSNSKVVLGP